MSKKKKFEEVEIEMNDDQFMKLALMAHEQDITINQLCNNILKEQIDRMEKDLKK